MTKEEDNHKENQKLTDQIADGKAIDWHSYESTTDSEILNKIKAIEQITQAFTQTILTEQSTVPGNHTRVLFKWAHLQVIEKVGEGSFGEVFKAYDSILNRAVALKLRHADMASAIGSRAFLHEARRLARVRHPNVIAVHGAAFEAGQVGIWTDLIEGKNLKEHFIEKGVITINEAHLLIKDMAQALSAVHQADLVHGDIKSSNIMRQKKGVFKLMDFGAGSELTDSGLNPTLGTPLLMAPELFNGEPISPASDLYSLGAMLYQILSGQYPFIATSAIGIKQLHQESTIVPLQKLRPEIPRPLCELIHSLLSPQPHKRPTAAQVINQIAWINDAPKRKKRTWAIATVIGSLTLGMIISSWGYLNAVTAEKKALLAKQESIAVSDFLADIIKSARPGESGKNTPIIEVLEQAEKRLENSLLDQPLARAEVFHHIGKSFERISLFKAASDALKKAHDIRVKHLGKHHIDTLTTQGELGSALSFLARLDEAKKLLLIDDEIINTLPLENNKRMNFLVNQTLYYKLNGQYKKALTILKTVLATVNKKQHPDYYYDLLLQYGNSLLNQLQFTEAEEAFNDVYHWAKSDSSRKALLLRTRSAMVRLYGQTQRFDKAETYARLNIQIASQWLGSEDESVIWLKTLLSKALYEQGKIEQSTKINLEALNLSNKKFGESYWLTLNLMSDRASRLQSLNRLDEAIAQYQKTIKIAEQVFPNHNYSVLPWKNLTALYYNTGKYKLASELAQKAIPFMIKRRSADHESTLELRFHYGASLLYQGKTTIAVEELSALLPVTEKNLGEDHSLVKNIKSVLADSVKFRNEVR